MQLNPPLRVGINPCGIKSSRGSDEIAVRGGGGFNSTEAQLRFHPRQRISSRSDFIVRLNAARFHLIPFWRLYEG